MPDSGDYRDNAYRCAELASRASNASLRVILLDMAQSWLRLATELERAYGLLEDTSGLLPHGLTAEHYESRAAVWEKKAETAPTRGQRKHYLKLVETARTMAREVRRKRTDPAS
jgi:hypothetical protein